MVHTRDLAYFLAVADHRHVTRAAKSLYVTQSALSKQLAALEKSLDARLFERIPAGMALTPAGEALQEYAREMLKLEAEATAAVRRATAAEKVTLGFWTSPPTAVLSKTVAEFSAMHRSVGLRLRRADWSERAGGVLGGRADVAIVQTKKDRVVHGLAGHRVVTEPIMLAVPVGHRLAGRDSVTVDDMVDEVVLVLPESAGNLAGVHFSPEAVKRIRNVEYISTTDETNEAVAAHLGVSPTLESVAQAHPHPLVVHVPIEGATPSETWVVWREEDERRPEIRDLAASLVRSLDAWIATWNGDTQA